MKNCVLFDVDHTISHAAPRDHLIGGSWEEYHLASINDKLCSDVACLLDAFRIAGFFLVAITARPEKFRALTQKWLLLNRVPVDEILMRKDDDYRPAGELKIAMAKARFGEDLTQEVLAILDDNDDVIKAFAEEGITCLQVRGRDY